MAHLEHRYRCPICELSYKTLREAQICRNKHPIKDELWAVSVTGKAVRVFANMDEKSALKEADMSDYVHVREKQLKGELPIPYVYKFRKKPIENYGLSVVTGGKK